MRQQMCKFIVFREGIMYFETSDFNQYVTQIHPSSIREFDEMCNQVDGIIKLTLGEPDFETPQHIKEAGIQAIQHNLTKYTPTPGIMPLREAVSHFVKEKYQQHYAPQDVMITHGATEALSSIMGTLLNPGDKVIIPSPFFTLYETMVRLNGGVPILIDTSINGFVLSESQLQNALLEHGERVKAVILNYPTNPTGMTLTRAQAESIASVLRGKKIFVISDEVYSELVFEGDHVSIATMLPEQTIVVNAASKSHAMTGWRIGFTLAPSNITRYLMNTHQNYITTTNSISQIAMLEAFTHGIDDAKMMRETYKARRDFVYEKMTALGFDIIKPTGAFYILAKIPADFGQDGYQFAVDLAQKGRVATIPGSAFGIGAEAYIRLSIAASDALLEEAMNRLTTFITSERSQQNSI